MKPIFEYLNYREFLGDYYEENKASRAHFTYRYFATKAGLGSHIYLQMVIRGRRNLSHRSIPKFIQGLGLQGKEASYFESLVFFNQAQDSRVKSEYLKRLEEHRAKGKGKAQAVRLKSRSSLFSRWYYPVIYEMANRVDFREDETWLVKKLKNRIKPSEARNALKVLIEEGLLVRDDSGRLKMRDYQIRTEDEVENLLIRNYHRKMIEIGSQHLDDPIEAREMGFLTVSSTPENFRKLKEAIKEFIARANEEMTVREGATETYQMNVQLFRLVAGADG